MRDKPRYDGHNRQPAGVPLRTLRLRRWRRRWARLLRQAVAG